MIKYLKGDATSPHAKGQKIIAHVCNDVGAWGAGFVLALSKRWPEPEESYRDWYSRRKMPLITPFALGSTCFVSVTKDITVANMIAQHGIGVHGGQPPIRYDALQRCLVILGNTAFLNQSSIHMPRISCGLAGGSWDKVLPLIEKWLSHADVYVYDLE